MVYPKKVTSLYVMIRCNQHSTDLRFEEETTSSEANAQPTMPSPDLSANTYICIFIVSQTNWQWQSIGNKNP